MSSDVHGFNIGRRTLEHLDQAQLVGHHELLDKSSNRVFEPSSKVDAVVKED